MLKTIPVQSLPTWQEVLSDLVTDPQILLDMLSLDAQTCGFSANALKSFPLRVPKPYLARMEPGNPHDPLLLQVLPALAETLEFSGFVDDPLEEDQANKMPGLLHKYQGRVLLMPTSSCAIHCRYCFRRHFPYASNRPNKKQWQESLDYISNNASIQEVILSGGDPLAISDKHLAWLLDGLAQIPHVERLRIHTRLPIMIPQRVTREFCDLLTGSRLASVLILHSNHKQEFDSAVDNACQQLKDAGITLLNQSVLLRGINDSVSDQVKLSERLFQAGVLPYYLHMPDRVKGTAHFMVGDDRAREIHQGMQAKLPGYLVPRLVREVAGMPAKMLLNQGSEA